MKELNNPELLQAGDSCLVVQFGDTIDLAVNGSVQGLRRALEQEKPLGLVEMVPTYCSLAVYFDPTRTDRETLAARIEELAQGLSVAGTEGGDVLTVPVLYGGEEGPDLQAVADHNGLTAEEVVRRHSGRDYYCYMLGFTPGFPYLGGMDESIATPRLAKPRTRIPAGSVGIAGKQTGIYPIDSPGGWQLIGRTPLRLFDPTACEPFLADAGLWIRFKPISRSDFEALARDVASGTFQAERTPRREEQQ